MRRRVLTQDSDINFMVLLLEGNFSREFVPGKPVRDFKNIRKQSNSQENFFVMYGWKALKESEKPQRGLITWHRGLSLWELRIANPKQQSGQRFQALSIANPMRQSTSFSIFNYPMRLQFLWSSSLALSTRCAPGRTGPGTLPKIWTRAPSLYTPYHQLQLAPD